MTLTNSMDFFIDHIFREGNNSADSLDSRASYTIFFLE